MKTAISLPDSLFERAERVAQQLNMKRSQLYAEALRAYLDKHDPDSITVTLNDIYASESSELDPVAMQLQVLSLPEDDW